MEGIIVRSLSQRSHPGRSVTLLKNLQGKNWKNYRAEKSEKLKREDNIDRFMMMMKKKKFDNTIPNMRRSKFSLSANLLRDHAYSNDY